ncbi:hypothetical protein, partial [Paracraurococcus ruber]
MPDAAPPPRPGTPALPFRGAEHRYRCLMAQGCDEATAMAELVAYLVVLRPGLPRVLAQDQAAAIAAGYRAAQRPPAPPPQPLLV